MNRDFQREFDFYNGDDTSFDFVTSSTNVLTDLPGNGDNYFRVGLLNTSPYFLEPYFKRNERFEIVKPTALLPGSVAPSNSHDKDCKNPEKCSCLIEKQMKQEGFGSNSAEVASPNVSERKIDPDILSAMQGASVKTNRISTGESLKKKSISKDSAKPSKKTKIDLRDKFKFVN